MSNFRNLIGEILFLPPKKKLSNFPALFMIYLFIKLVLSSVSYAQICADLVLPCEALQYTIQCWVVKSTVLSAMVRVFPRLSVVQNCMFSPSRL